MCFQLSFGVGYIFKSLLSFIAPTDFIYEIILRVSVGKSPSSKIQYILGHNKNWILKYGQGPNLLKYSSSEK